MTPGRPESRPVGSTAPSTHEVRRRWHERWCVCQGIEPCPARKAEAA